jgi:hypothetical protein
MLAAVKPEGSFFRIMVPAPAPNLITPIASGKGPAATKSPADHRSIAQRRIRSAFGAAFVHVHTAIKNAHTSINLHWVLMSRPGVMRLSFLTCTSFLMRSFPAPRM